MGKIIRTISADASVVASVIEAKDIVSEIEHVHKTSAVVTAGHRARCHDRCAGVQPRRADHRVAGQGPQCGQCLRQPARD